MIVKDQSKRLSCEEIIPRLLAIQLSAQIKKDESACVLPQMALRFFPAPELKERDLANNNLEQSQHAYATENMVEEGIRILHEATRSIKLSNLKIQ